MQKVKAYSSKIVYAIAISLCILLSAFIFNMSGEVATESAERSGSISEKIATVVVKDFEKLDKVEKEEVIFNIDRIIRKIAHFCMYAALGALFVFASLYHSRTWRMHLLLSWLFATLYAISDEIHQSLVPGRGPRFSDVILDSAGSFCGILFVMAVTVIVLRKAKVK